MKLNRILLGLAATATFATSAFAQDTIRNREDGEYFFTIVKNLDANPVESQDRTGTCWSFSTLSYLESELLRTGKGKHILSEMYIVRKAYEDKAVNYVRMNGHFNFGAGGAFQDIPYVIKKYGIVPQVEYIGREYGYNGGGCKKSSKNVDQILEEGCKRNS
jgi:bleomycin hydrolase